MSDQNRNHRNHSNHSEQSLPAQTTTIARDLSELLRLRFEHAKLELSEFFDKWTNNLLRNALAIAVVALGGIFLLTAAGLALGSLLGHAAWGMLIVGGALVLAGGVFALTRPKFIDTGDKKATVDPDVLEPMPPQGRPITEGP
jgi:hypothetical protein